MVYGVDTDGDILSQPDQLFAADALGANPPIQLSDPLIAGGQISGFIITSDSKSVLYRANSIEGLGNLYAASLPEGLLFGDANNDGLVTGADLIAIQQNFANTGPPNDGTLVGDANDDGLVTGADLIAVQQNFGKTLTPTSAQPVPEPATAMGVLLGGAALLRRT